MDLYENKIPPHKTINDILEKINEIEKKKVYRKAVLSDFMKDPPKMVLDSHPSIKIDKSQRYRIQGEFGEKKFIKP